MYGLNSDTSKKDMRNKVEELSDSPQFIYKVCMVLFLLQLDLIMIIYLYYMQDPKNKTGIYHAPIIHLLINKIFFRNKTDDGATNPKFSEDRKLPMVTIALILTIVSFNVCT